MYHQFAIVSSCTDCYLNLAHVALLKAVVQEQQLTTWDPSATLITKPSYLMNLTVDPPGPHIVESAYCLLFCGDYVTTDHILPIGNIEAKSVAGKYIIHCGVQQDHLESFGSRFGDEEVIKRGTFSNVGFYPGLRGYTVYVPTGKAMKVFRAATVSC